MHERVMLNAEGGPFAEEFLRAMLTLHSVSFFIKPEEEARYPWLPMVKGFYQRFQKWLISDSELLTGMTNQWFFQVVPTTTITSPQEKWQKYCLRYMSSNGLTRASLLDNKQAFRMYLNLEATEEAPFEMSFSDVVYGK